MDITEHIILFLEQEKRLARTAKKREKNVGIDPDTYIAKEIKYQTAVLKSIQNDIGQIKLSIQESYTSIGAAQTERLKATSSRENSTSDH